MIKIEESCKYIKGKTDMKPGLAMVFGSGVSSEEILDNVDVRISYNDIPHLKASTVENHKGELIIGQRKGKEIALFSGRLHYYEGYDAKEITYPIRIMKGLGVRNLILTNAAGGVNPQHNNGDIMLITDHINLFPDHPLRGPNQDLLGPRFPDMLNAYQPSFGEQILSLSKSMDIPIHEGVYLASQGPSLETPAEYGMMRAMGADAVGMSTVLETIVAIHSGMKVGAFSIISNVCFPLDRIVPTTHANVVDTVNRSQNSLMKLVGAWIDAFYLENEDPQ